MYHFAVLNHETPTVMIAMFTTRKRWSLSASKPKHFKQITKNSWSWYKFCRNRESGISDTYQVQRSPPHNNSHGWSMSVQIRVLSVQILTTCFSCRDNLELHTASSQRSLIVNCKLYRESFKFRYHAVYWEQLVMLLKISWNTCNLCRSIEMMTLVLDAPRNPREASRDTN